jgi:hypothetical protein
VGLDLVLRDRLALADDDERPQALAPLLVRDADDRRIADRRVREQQLLDLAGEDVLPARDDHVVVAAIDEQPAAGVEVADVAARHQPVDDLLRAAAGVALERHRVADEDPAGRADVDVASVVVDDPHPGAARHPADATRLDRQILGRRDRRVGDLGRAVQVVDHRPERRGRAHAQLGAELRAGDEDDPQRREVAAGAGLVAEVEHLPEHHRDDDQRARPVALEVVERELRVEPATQHHRRAEHHPQDGVGETERVEQRRADHRRLARPERRLREQRPERGERVRRLALGALRRASGPAREDDHRAVHLGLRRRRGVAFRDQRVESVLAGRLGPRAPAAERRLDAVEELRVLVVVHEHARALAVGDLADLRAGEVGVQEDRAGAAPGGRVRRCEEAAVVAGEDRHALPGAQAAPAPGVGERVHAGVELGVGDRPGLVDHRDAVGVAGGREGERPAERAPARDSPDAGHDGLRRVELEHARAGALTDVEQLVTAARGPCANPVHDRHGSNIASDRYVRVSPMSNPHIRRRCRDDRVRQARDQGGRLRVEPRPRGRGPQARRLRGHDVRRPLGRQPVRRPDLQGPPARRHRPRAVLGAPWQIRGQADKRQVDGVQAALQHNIGLGGAAVVSVYRKAA